MKHLLLLSLLFIIACKVEEQKNSNVSAETHTNLSASQVGVTSENVTSNEVDAFVNDLEQRQAASPDTMFEVVNTDKKSSSTVKAAYLKDDALYPNKNFYILIGLGKEVKDTTIAKTDWDAVYYIMAYLSKHQFRVMINVQATAKHLKMASEDNDTSVILWSSHGNKQAFYDYNGEAVPYDIFKNKSKNFYQLLLSSCEGRIALENYMTYGLKTLAWKGLTNSTELKNYIVSDAWSAYSGKILVAPKSGITCTSDGTKYALMQSESRKATYGYTFDNLENCKARVDTINNQTVCSNGDQGVRKVNTSTLALSDERYENMLSCLGSN